MPSRPPSDHDAAAEPDASAAPSPASLPEQLLMLTLAASRLMVTEVRRSAPEAWLTAPQFRTLHYIYNHPRASLSQVAQHLGVRLPTASVILVKLADEGLV